MELAKYFFKEIVSRLSLKPHDGSDVCYVAVVPTFKTEIPFVCTLSNFGELELIQKNSTKQAAWLKQQWTDFQSNINIKSRKNDFKCIYYTTNYLAHIAKTKKIIIMDHGGYFAESSSMMHRILADKLLGIVEFTDNGIFRYKKYLAPEILPCIFSVAHSPLKACADYSSGETIALCIKSAINDSLSIDIKRSMSVGVIGYGNIGSAVAEKFKKMGVAEIYVNDIDSSKIINASVKGFKPASMLTILQQCDIIVSASGTAKALEPQHYSHMKNGVFLATVTSPDDELGLENLIAENVITHIKKIGCINEYQSHGKKIFLIANGEAPNVLIENGILSPTIYLAKAEYLVAGILLRDQAYNSKQGLHTLPFTTQQVISSAWLEFYGGNGFAD